MHCRPRIDEFSIGERTNDYASAALFVLSHRSRKRHAQLATQFQFLEEEAKSKNRERENEDET